MARGARKDANKSDFKTVTCDKCHETVTKRKTLGRQIEVKHKDEKTGKVRKTWKPVRICRAHFPKNEQHDYSASAFVGKYNVNPLAGAGTLGG